MTKRPSKQQPAARTDTPPAHDTRPGMDLLALRAQLHRAEKAARKPPEPAPSTKKTTTPLKPQRAVDLDGVNTDEFSLGRAHLKLREAVYDARYHICPHAIQHARAEGFLEHDIMHVLLAGRVKAVYTQEHRWLVAGYFEAHGVKLPLHVVVQHYRDGHVDIVTAFVPKNPHHIISRARLALMLRYDDERIRTRTAQAGNKVGYRSKGKWKKSA
ncbi:DUF4258 domain-containing protein [Deinococcus ficus]|uniref:DUF4258 domain-containing protein n=1 Tax=Deinococcus ficus TaxID=317577 RepID=A0A221SUC6_9DEIO|nr:DUF4258 domain-containing protein [Deinococcus ficus]ASN80248.1 DUF4258 domain-containing protein [Deinococcus ficus]